MVRTVRRRAAQASVQRSPAQAVQIAAEGRGSGEADHHLRRRLDARFAPDVLRELRAELAVDLAETVARHVRERAADRAQGRRLADGLPVESVAIALRYLDELRQHVFRDLFGRLLRGLPRDPGQQARQALHERALHRYHRGPAGGHDLRDQRCGERVCQRPQHFRGRHGDRDQHAVLGVLDVQRLLPQRRRLRPSTLDVVRAQRAQIAREVRKIVLDVATDVRRHVLRQLVETLARRRDVARDLVPLRGQLAELVLVALRPGVTRDDVEDPVQAGIHHQAHRE
ncbi:hypothetical protein OG494_17210 [Amycolatopsis sp. NBC_00438]